MIKLFFITITCLFLAFGCGTPHKGYKLVNGELINSINSKCTLFFKEVKEKWAISQDSGCYYYHKKLSQKIIENKDCFIGIEIAEIEKLLGSPSVVSIPNYDYELSKNCYTTNKYLNKFYTLKFVGDKTVKKVEFNPVVWID